MMILLALAALAQPQPMWTGPRTVEYRGPGNYCGGGYSIALARADRALILPQGQGPQATRLVLAGREVNIQNGARPGSGPVVVRYGGTVVTQENDGGVTYIVSDSTGFGLRLLSDSFHGYKADRWFFSHADFRDGPDQGRNCLPAYSY